jgi:predicted ATPase
MVNDRLSIGIKEKYNLERFYYEEDISDGTVNIMILILILYFRNSLVTVLEEIEKGLHPYLMERVMEMISDASQLKQIIVTTHNSQLLDFINKNDLYLIYRDESGFSHVVKPINFELVNKFLSYDSQLSELFLKDLLEPNE